MTSARTEPFAYRVPDELAGGTSRHRVAIVGAGPVGLAAAIDCALHGIACVVLDDNDVVSTGSRAICWSKRTLEIFDRLGAGDRMVAKGVTWNVGRVFHRDREIWNFDLLPETGHKMPAFINLQQYHVERMLVERAMDFPDLIDLRWRNRVTGVAASGGEARLAVETPDGIYHLEAEWVLACDGARSSLRGLLGLHMEGRAFEERFLIADVRMKAAFPSERWFWFEPPFHGGQSALLHKQPDDIYRIDLQLGPDADPDLERRPDNVLPRIRAMLGHGDFELEWVSVYAFQCRRLARFVHGPVVFVGDSAHVVSPFGARGGNGGVQDADNLVWKLAAVMRGEAPRGLVETYDEERSRAADENILNSSRATAFMTPKSPVERMLRDSVLELAREHTFAQRLVNSGRLSKPCGLAGLSLQTPSCPGDALVGSAAPDAPVSGGWLLNALGTQFVLLTVDAHAPAGIDSRVRQLRVSRDGQGGALRDCDGLVAERYGAGATVLVRPDQHVAARFFDPGAAECRAALDRATGHEAAGDRP